MLQYTKIDNIGNENLNHCEDDSPLQHGQCIEPSFCLFLPRKHRKCDLEWDDAHQCWVKKVESGFFISHDVLKTIAPGARWIRK